MKNKTKNDTIVVKNFRGSGLYYEPQLPVLASNYRKYLSCKANIYKKYYGKVRKAVAEGRYSSVAAYKNHRTQALDWLDYKIINWPEGLYM